VHQLAILTLAHPVQVLYAFNTIDEEHAVQVVYFVVNHHRIKALKDPVEGITRFVQAGVVPP
jgi:hypothetical protein